MALPPAGRGEGAAIRQLAILVALSLICAILVLISNRPDIDDAFFLSISADALTHPDKTPLSGDTMFGDPRLPLLVPAYRVHSMELLAATMAYHFGGEPIF